MKKLETGGTADSAENGGANIGGTLGSSMMKKGGGVGQVKAKAWIITEEGGLPKVKAYKTIMEAHNNVYKQGGHQINSLSRLKDFLSAKYDINNVEPYMYVKQMANGGGLANVPESFPETDAMSYKNGGEVGYSKKERVIDYYYQNDVFDDYETYDLSEEDLNNENKVIKSIIKYHGLNKPENVNERFEVLFGEDEMAKGGSTKGFEYSIGGL
jgi:hypothetical protein